MRILAAGTRAFSRPAGSASGNPLYTLDCTAAGVIKMLWGCIAYLPVFFISELNFLFLMLISFISPQGFDL
ncbi:TPA: hypothetical protein BOS_14578 [Bos taurus]|nr:TPA: hypothetical protein BOS_14578 [Bos taurus]